MIGYLSFWATSHNILVSTYPRDYPRAQAKCDSTPARDNTSCWCDGNEAGNHALNSSNDRGSLEVPDIHQDPNKGAHCGTYIRVKNCGTSVGAGSIRITTIKAIPPYPEDSSSDKH